MIVGVDVSKSSFDVSYRVDDQVVHRCYSYDDAGIEQLLLDTQHHSLYVMEATGSYHTRLAVHFHDAGHQVGVVNPLVVKRFGQMHLSRVKSDKADAQLIRQYGEEQQPDVWSPSCDDIIELQQAHSWLDDLIRERTRLVNRQEAQRHQARPSAFVLQQMSQQRAQLSGRIKACEEHLESVVKKSSPEVYERLQTIPSIGSKTALELIVVTNGFSRFANDKSLSAYVGISPTTYSSGTSVRGRGHIAKLGQGRMRQLLYLCSWTARRSNRSCRELYERLHAAGKPNKVINIAIAHKLLRQAFAVARQGVDYCENAA